MLRYIMFISVAAISFLSFPHVSVTVRSLPPDVNLKVCAAQMRGVGALVRGQ